MPINYIDYNQPSGGGGDFGWQLIKGRDISISSYSKILSFETYDSGNKTKITVESNGHRLAVSDVIKIEIYTYDNSTEYVGSHTVSSIIDSENFVINTAWDSDVDTDSNSYRFTIPAASNLSDVDTFLIDVGNTGNQSTTKPISALTMKSYFGGSIDVSGTHVVNDYARFTDADTLEGRSYSELASDIGSSINTIGTVTTGTLSTGAVLADVTMTLGSDADGDIYYRSSNKLTRLAKGTAGQALVMNSGATAPEWGAAGSSIDESNPILDSNGNELLEFTALASAENHIKIHNAVDGGIPKISSAGDDSNIGLYLETKGTGLITFLENGKIVTFDLNGATAAKTTTLDFNHTDDRTITFPDVTGEVVLDSNLSIQDDTSPALGGNLQLNGNVIVQSSTNPIILRTNGNRDITFDFDGATSDKTLTLVSNHTDNRTLTFPDYTGTLAHTDQVLIKSTTELEAELANIDSNVFIGNSNTIVTTVGRLKTGGNGAHGYINAPPRSGDNLAGYRLLLQGGTSTGSADGGSVILSTALGDGTGAASDVNDVTHVFAVNGNQHVGIKAASKLFLDGVYGNGATYIQEVSDNKIRLVAGGADMLTLDEGNSLITLGGAVKGTQIELAETSTPGNQTSGFGTFYINDGKPYFKNDDDEVKKLDIGFWDEQWSMRWYNKEDDWYTFSTSYGPNYYHWNKNLGNGLLASWLDTYTPGIVVPRDITLTGYNLKGRASYSNTYELKMVKATPNWGTDGSHNLSSIGSTQSKAITASVSDTIGETGLSVSLSEGDILIPQFRKTINPVGDTVTRYFYGVFSIQGDYA